MMRRLSHRPPSNSGLTTSAGSQLQLHPSLQPSEPRVASCDNNNAGARPRHQPLDKGEGIESTLFAHVIFAARFLQTVVANDPYSNVPAEMAAVLDNLQSTVNIQKQQNENLEDLPPFSKSLPLGHSFRDLPIPSMDRILACLRFAHGSYALASYTEHFLTDHLEEHSPTRIYWPFEFGSLGDFTQYVIKACSPGPVTDAELIIVHYGLYYLFTECANSAGDDITKEEYEAQALICRDSLETILSNLSFYVSTNTDSVCAMYMASIYCLQRGKPFGAWTFISRASLMSQALGLHSNHVMAAESAEEGQRKIRLFWALYVLEKAVSLRLGRPSTIRDHDVTVPRPLLDRKMTSLLYNRLPDWIDVASLYGRVYDYVYSPSALAQPVSARESRTRALAAELERIMAARAELYKLPNQWTSHVIHPEQCRFIIHANRATDYSILASIYRGIPASKASSLMPCPECLSAARAALKEAEVCTATLADATVWSPAHDIWISEVCLLASFMPFLILFCNIVETSDPSDLGYLRRLVDGLPKMAQSSRYSICIKQMRILKVLYDVATTYVKARTRRQSTDMTGGHFPDFDINTYPNDKSGTGPNSPFPSLFTEPDALSLGGAQKLAAACPTGTAEDESQQVMSQTSGFQASHDFLAMQSHLPGDFITELDTPGAQVGSWFHQSHQLMRLLDDI
ncbi:protein STB5 [Aspergillus udagawae]|nr:protein STB5 [Aspergillus udagawae]